MNHRIRSRLPVLPWLTCVVVVTVTSTCALAQGTVNGLEVSHPAAWYWDGPQYTRLAIPTRITNVSGVPKENVNLFFTGQAHALGQLPYRGNGKWQLRSAANGSLYEASMAYPKGLLPLDTGQTINVAPGESLHARYPYVAAGDLANGDHFDFVYRVRFCVYGGGVPAGGDYTQWSVPVEGEGGVTLPPDPGMGHGQQVYWVDYFAETISRANYDGSNLETVVDLDPAFSSSWGVGLDPDRGWMYWSLSGGSTSLGKIQRAHLDGSNVEDVVPTGLEYPLQVRVDSAAGKIYWVAGDSSPSGSSPSQIQRADLNGDNVEALVTLTDRYIFTFALDLIAGKMYWSWGCNWFDCPMASPYGIQRANLTGTNIEDVIALDFDDVPVDLAIDPRAERLYWASPYLPPSIRRSALDGSELEYILGTSQYNPRAVALDLRANKLYWSLPGATLGAYVIRRADLDTWANIEDVVTAPSVDLALDVRDANDVVGDVNPGDPPVVINPSNAGSGTGDPTTDPLVAFGYLAGPVGATIGVVMGAGTVTVNPTIEGDCCLAHNYAGCYNGGETCIGGTADGLPCAVSTECGGLCVGGFDDGTGCADDVDCRHVCVGGANDGDACLTGSHCDGGSCFGDVSCEGSGQCAGGCPGGRQAQVGIEFRLTVTIPFDEASLNGLDPLSIDLVSSGWHTPAIALVLAVAGNTANSPGHDNPVGDRFAETGIVDLTLGDLSDELGDYGVFWNTDTRRGFVWANVDYAADFTLPNPAPIIPRNRYVSFEPINTGTPVKLKVTLTDSLPHPLSVGSSWWVQAPVVPVPAQFPKPALGAGECVALLGPEATAANIDWVAAGCQVLHVTGCPIEPTSEYEVRAVDGANESHPLTVATILKPGVKWWGDTVGVFNGTEWTPPQGVTNIDDVVAGIKTFQGGPVVPPGPVPPGNVAHLSIPDVDPGDINMVVNFNDVFLVILAFQGEMYPFGPADADGNCP